MGVNSVANELTSIVILTRNKLDYSKLCLDSIREYTPVGDYEIIVVDNHSTDGTVEWLKSQPDLRLVLNSENRGFPAGCNQGLKLAKGNSVLLLNNDTVVTPNWLLNLSKCLFGASDIGAVGAVTNSCSNFQAIPYDYASIREMVEFARKITISNAGCWENRGRLVGFCMLIKAEVISKIGLLDEVFSPGNYEDDDYSLRIRKAGYRLVLCRDTFIHHFGSISFGEQAEGYNALLDANRKKFIAKWGVDPHGIVEYEKVQDAELNSWFTYQNELVCARQLVENAKNRFLSVLERAEFSLLSGDLEKAVQLSMQAAVCAYSSHPGFYISPWLEVVLRKVAQKLANVVTGSLPQLPVKSTEKRNVLHVISQADHSLHTRFVERWIRCDDTSIHSFAVTLDSKLTPQGLVEAASQSGGWYAAMDTANLSFCQRAKLLRDMALAWADVVVLHIHPQDSIASVAFGTEGGPPVAFVNYNDQGFSIGMSSADVAVDLRSAGQVLTRTRRHIRKSFLLPMPMDESAERIGRTNARQILDIDAGKIVVLTVADAYKLMPCGTYNFFTLIKDIVKRHDNVEIVVVGPADSGPWACLKEESRGKIRAFPSQNDVTLFYSAADIYLDSMPLGSFRQALEAAARGIPVVGLTTHSLPGFAQDIAPGIKTHYPSSDELLTTLSRLVSDAEYRDKEGKNLKEAILSDPDAGWIHNVNKLYRLLPAEHKPFEVEAENEETAENADVLWAFMQARAGLSRDKNGNIGSI
ncbi:MAG: rhamnosyltran: rhamnosyltransferase [Firmicutes bacterium]|nr:rhamnosyltran: rhamnosyltransferase [Bacillota bacterium]